MVHHPSVQLHHSSVLFCTTRQHSSAPFVSSVLHHSLSPILRHLVMLFYNYSASSNNLATEANTPCRLFNCIVEILVLGTAAYRTFRLTSRRINSTVEIQLHYTSVKSMFFCPAAELLVNSVYYRHLIVALRSTPFILCISALLCLHFCIC